MQKRYANESQGIDDITALVDSDTIWGNGTHEPVSLNYKYRGAAIKLPIANQYNTWEYPIDLTGLGYSDASLGEKKFIKRGTQIGRYYTKLDSTGIKTFTANSYTDIYLEWSSDNSYKVYKDASSQNTFISHDSEALATITMTNDSERMVCILQAGGGGGSSPSPVLAAENKGGAGGGAGGGCVFILNLSELKNKSNICAHFKLGNGAGYSEGGWGTNGRDGEDSTGEILVCNGLEFKHVAWLAKCTGGKGGYFTELDKSIAQGGKAGSCTIYTSNKYVFNAPIDYPGQTFNAAGKRNPYWGGNGGTAGKAGHGYQSQIFWTYDLAGKKWSDTTKYLLIQQNMSAAGQTGAGGGGASILAAGGAGGDTNNAWGVGYTGGVGAGGGGARRPAAGPKEGGKGGPGAVVFFS